MNPFLSKKTVFFGAGIVLILASFGLGVFFGYENRPEVEKVFSLFGKESEIIPGTEIDFSPFWKSWRAIEEKYVSSDGVDRQKMVWGSIEGLAMSLGDPYTVFFPPAENKAFEDEIRGDFEGVGMEIGTRKGVLTVIAPLNGTPAHRAGIKSGDKILKIGDDTTSDLDLNEAVQKIKGPKGSEVKLTILRNGEDATREISVVRDIIQIPLIDTEKRDGGIFIIRLYSFSERSPSAFRSALREMVESGSNKLILDLRNNPGGFLEAAVDISSWFLPAGKTVVKESFGKAGEKIHRSKGYNVLGESPIVILVNNGSASASEIVAGALRDYGIAKLVGVKTFGKGSVQELVSITSDTSLKLTIARWLTPNGHSISENGLDPDVVAEGAKENDESVDPQLEKAIEIIKDL